MLEQQDGTVIPGAADEVGICDNINAARIKSAWQIACEWYTTDEIHHCLLMSHKGIGLVPKVPRDITSRDFAEWLTDQYRMAMAKGIQLGRRQQ